MALKLETSEAGQTGRGVHRSRARRPDTEERSERGVRLVTHGDIDVSGRVHRISNGAVVEEAGAELPDVGLSGVIKRTEYNGPYRHRRWRHMALGLCMGYEPLAHF